MTYETFQKIKPDLTAALAKAFEAKLKEMGEDVKGISWFSSCAEGYNKHK
jgi:hypothetical protein